METLNINNNAYTPKFNFAFYKQVSKENAADNQDGFTMLVNDLLAGSVDAIVSAYYYGMAWYKHNQPSQGAIVNALSDTVFADEERTQKEFDNIIEEMKASNFLKAHLNQFVKDMDENMDLMQERVDKEADDNPDKDTEEAVLKRMTGQLDHLKQLILTPSVTPGE